MRAIVTGGAGFIGSHLVDRLVADGADVTVIDNLRTGRRSNLDAAIRSGHATLVQLDIAGALDEMRKLFRDAAVVFHLAGLADIVPSIERPEDYFRANVDGTFAVVEAARDAGVPRIVYAASSSCYGIPDSYPTSEAAELRPQYPYALTKLLGEQIVLHWGKVYGISTTSLRLFNVYGPRSRTTGTYGAVFGVFLAQKLAGKPYTVVGDGKQTRDFTFVSDVVDAFVTAAAVLERGGPANQIYNVGSGATQSINRLVELLGGDVVHIPKRPGEPDCTFADTSKIARELHWRPQVRFEDGVAGMLQAIDAWRDAPLWDPDSIEKATKTWFERLGSTQTVGA
ncbi:MAG TPA: SDR family oxidoreductase [Candidatus Baltobacteraceae bacterium]|jgi:UDP-glucose 4-epimerase